MTGILAVISVADYSTLAFSAVINAVGVLLYGLGNYKSWPRRRCCRYEKVDASEIESLPAERQNTIEEPSNLNEIS